MARRPPVSCPAVATIHLLPTAPLAERVLLPGDPGRALLLAQALLAEPKMFNHNRGLWGYTGEARDGRPLTIQSTAESTGRGARGCRFIRRHSRCCCKASNRCASLRSAGSTQAREAAIWRSIYWSRDF